MATTRVVTTADLDMRYIVRGHADGKTCDGTRFQVVVDVSGRWRATYGDELLGDYATWQEAIEELEHALFADYIVLRRVGG